jgi:hypothetical protein
MADLPPDANNMEGLDQHHFKKLSCKVFFTYGVTPTNLVQITLTSATF